MLEVEGFELGVPSLDSEHGPVMLLFARKPAAFKDKRSLRQLAKLGVALVGKPMTPEPQQVWEALHLRLALSSESWIHGSTLEWTWVFPHLTTVPNPAQLPG